MLDAIFTPKSVAVIGATEKPGSVGRTVLANLCSTPFGGKVYPVNPKRPAVLGHRAYASVADIPEPVDLAVIVTPAASVPGVIAECVHAKVRGAIVISAGFKEMGPRGAELERELQQVAEQGKLRLIGPNCLGLMNPVTGLNATFARGIARPGSVAFISQSGALCTAVLDWSFQEMIGFSAFVSVGSMLNVGWGDLIDYLGNDPHTRSILIYMESIGDARSFLSAAREVALTKPIIVIKAGRTEQASKAAASHTGALTGSDEVLNAAFRRVGVLRVDNIADLFYMAEVLSKQPRPRGRKLTIVTNAGGPAVLATDSLVLGGGELTTLAPETHSALNELLPPHWSRNNPIDILGDSDAARYAAALKIAAADPGADGLLVIMTMQDMTDPADVAKALAPYASLGDKPILASWMGGPGVEQGRDILNKAGIPTFPYPDTAARAFNYLCQYDTNLRAIYETPTLPSDDVINSDSVRKFVSEVRLTGRTLLAEAESKQLLGAYGIPTVPTEIARSADEAVTLAGTFGYPAVLKLHSHTITHKTDVGGVKLNLADERAVREAFETIRASVPPADFLGVAVQPMIKLRDAYELILGSSIDPQFGPVLLFGSGGQLVEVYRDRALGLPPLNATLALRLMEQTDIFRALAGVRGRKPIDIAKLQHLLVRFSRLVVEQPLISEIDINPLLASADGIVALDARVVLHPKSTDELSIPRPAIRPYPAQYVSSITLKNGTTAVMRPIRPEDESLMVRFHETLSDETVRSRYFHPIKLGERVAHPRLTRVCFNDYDREIALVVDRQTEHGHEILGIGRLSKVPGTDSAEYAVLVSDRCQNLGIGTKLLEVLLRAARDEGVHRVFADILSDNHAMQRAAGKLGFAISENFGEGTVRSEIVL